MILLTGANGFVGSFILKRLLQDSPEEIVIIRRSSSSNFSRINSVISNKVHVYDLSSGSISGLFKRFTIEAVVNAAVSYGRHADDGRMAVLNSNLLFPIQLIEEGLRNDLRVFVSTDSYFSKSDKVYSYLANYNLSKQSFLALLKSFSSELNTINMRLYHVFGPDDSAEKFVPGMVSACLKNLGLGIDLTGGNQIRDFVYVRDVADAFSRVLRIAMSSEFGFREYEVGTGMGTSIRDFVIEVKRLCQSTEELRFGSIPYRTDEIMNSVADTRDLNLLGWNCNYSITSGLKETIDAFKTASFGS